MVGVCGNGIHHKEIVVWRRFFGDSEAGRAAESTEEDSGSDSPCPRRASHGAQGPPSEREQVPMTEDQLHTRIEMGTTASLYGMVSALVEKGFILPTKKAAALDCLAKFCGVSKRTAYRHAEKKNSPELRRGNLVRGLKHSSATRSTENGLLSFIVQTALH